jgi:multimeric flavodoxin WrbA
MTDVPQLAPRRFLFLLGSARAGGNTDLLARQAAQQLPAHVSQRWIRLADVPLPAFEDVRHEGDGVYPVPVGNAKLLLDATLEATDVVIASPLYWYTVSASTKLYLDHWSGWLRVPGADFRARMAGKTLWGVSAHTSDTEAKTDPFVGTLRNTADYLRMQWGGALLGNGSRPGDIRSDVGALADAQLFFLSATARPALAAR